MKFCSQGKRHLPAFDAELISLTLRSEVLLIFSAFGRLDSFLTRHEQHPLVLDIARASLYIFSRWLDVKMGTKMSSQPAQLKTKFLSCPSGWRLIPAARLL